MLGRKKVVAALLVEIFPDNFVWHWCNYRLEFAVNDDVREIHEVDYLKSFFDEIYSLY
jgi:hypothetical protein